MWIRDRDTTVPATNDRAAAIVLGLPSAGHSHQRCYAYIWAAIRLHEVIVGGGRLLRGSTQAEHEKPAANDECSCMFVGHGRPAFYCFDPSELKWFVGSSLRYPFRCIQCA